MQIGGMVGMLSKDTMTDLRAEVARKDQELHNAQVEKETMIRRAKRLGITFDKAVA
jgi:hypothetical protein